jgi:hypothetical protein
VHAAVSSVGVGEITFLQRQTPEIVTRHGADLVELANEKVGKRHLRLVLGLDSMLRLMAGMRRLVHGLGRRLLAAWSPLRGGRGLEPAKFEFHQPGHGVELGLQVFEPRIVLALELLDEFVELSFMGVDLLFKQSSPVLQVPANITHLLPLVVGIAPIAERAGRFTQDQTNSAGHRARQVT